MARFIFRFLQTATCVAAIYLFVSGFLPLKIHPPNLSPHTVPKGVVSHVKRTVMIVVDALRIDFIDVNIEQNWPYLQNLIDRKNAHVSHARVHPPTVTLPRIKVSCYP